MFYIIELVLTFYNIAPTELFAQITHNNYHNYAPNGAIS